MRDHLTNASSWPHNTKKAWSPDGNHAFKRQIRWCYEGSLALISPRILKLANRVMTAIGLVKRKVCKQTFPFVTDTLAKIL
jgi:hypothetical protein